MAFDEQDWIARFVAQGGDRAAGATIARKMSSLSNSRGDSGLTAVLERACPAAPSPNTTSPALPVATATPPHIQAPSPEILPPPVDAGADQHSSAADLFGLAPAPAPGRASSVRRVITRAPARRGPKPAAFDAKPQTQKELDLYQLSMEIDKANAKETGELGFIAAAMISASLPHSKIDSGIFKRRNGDLKLTMMNDPEIGLPYGKIPRLITAFLCTEAKRNASTHGPQIFLGHSQADFMRKLGMSSRGGRNGDITRVYDQAKRLFTSSITLTGEPGGSEFHWQRVNISDKGMLLWNPHLPEQRARWQSTLTLSQAFFEECRDHAVPLHMAVLHSLRSPLAIDIYVWLTYRMKTIARVTPITWAQLKWQFGSNYAETAQGEYDFRSNFKTQLRAVLAVYRDAKVIPKPDVLLLYPSPTHIAAA